MKLPDAFARSLAERWLVVRWLGVLAICSSCAGSPHSPTAHPFSLSAPIAAELIAAELLPAEISTLGWDSLTGSPVVLLRELESGKVVPIWVGIAEGRAIAMALHGIEAPRPQTHDLMSNLIGELGAKLLEVWVHELRGDTYYGLLRLEVRGAREPLLVDTRPSDALALALRTGAPIRLARQIVDQAAPLDFQPPAASEQVVRAAGLTVTAVSDEVRRERGLPDLPGVLVVAVSGEAVASGLRVGDLVVELDGQPAAAPIALLDAVRRAPRGRPLRVTYWRDGEQRTSELPLGDPRSRLESQV
jgi:bifunctional DNase/RNase